MSASAGQYTIARRYATALFELAQEKGQLDAVEKDLRALAAVAAESADFASFAANASLSRDAQGQGAAAIAEHLNLSALTRQFLGAVAANRRLAALETIAQSALKMIAAHKGETTATVVSAQALDAAQAEKLTAQLKKLTGLAVQLEARVDPSLIGGLVVRVGDLRIDNSVKTKLERLHRALVNQTTATDNKLMKEVA